MIKASGSTHIGQVRSTNQDAYLIDQELGLYIVADGMGGHAGGEIASSIATTEIQKYHQEYARKSDLKTLQESEICQHLAEAVNHASSRIYERALEDPSLKGMGTTVTMILSLEEKVYCAHVGDSRLYLVRDNFIYQVTSDHSWVNEQVKAGNITQEEAAVHHLKNVITRCVGYQEEEDVDTTGFEINHDDILLLCSDGLHGKVHDKELSTIVSKREESVVTELIDLANSRGGDDNITAIVAYFQSSDEVKK